MIRDVTIIPETKTNRRVAFSLDHVGIYLLFWQEGDLVAGISFQWPFWYTKNPHWKSGLSVFSWDFEEIQEFKKNDPWFGGMNGSLKD